MQYCSYMFETNSMPHREVWTLSKQIIFIYIYIYAFSRRFYPKRLTVHSGYKFFFCQYMCSLGIEPTTFALLTQCSTTEPQEHVEISKPIFDLLFNWFVFLIDFFSSLLMYFHISVRKVVYIRWVLVILWFPAVHRNWDGREHVLFVFFISQNHILLLWVYTNKSRPFIVLNDSVRAQMMSNLMLFQLSRKHLVHVSIVINGIF